MATPHQPPPHRRPPHAHAEANRLAQQFGRLQISQPRQQQQTQTTTTTTVPAPRPGPPPPLRKAVCASYAWITCDCGLIWDIK